MKGFSKTETVKLKPEARVAMPEKVESREFHNHPCAKNRRGNDIYAAAVHEEVWHILCITHSTYKGFATAACFLD